MSTPAKPEMRPFDAKGNPSSAQPMRGLSERAQKMLSPRPYISRYAIEPAGGGIARHFKAKASI